MNLGKVLAFGCALATVLAAPYIYGRTHRYDLVAVAAGSGGSQNDEGRTIATAYLIDHQTGRVWLHSSIESADTAASLQEKPDPYLLRLVPLQRLNCADVGMTDTPFGCKEIQK
jgi:hypothetical protein